jgi:hypothetical protein
MNYKSFNDVIVINTTFDLPIDKSPADNWFTFRTDKKKWIYFERPKVNEDATELTNFFMTNKNKNGSKSKFGEGSKMQVLDKQAPSATVITKAEAQSDKDHEVPEKTDSAKLGGSRRVQKRSKQNKTNRRKGRRQNKSRRRNKRNSKRHNKTRK